MLRHQVFGADGDVERIGDLRDEGNDLKGIEDLAVDQIVFRFIVDVVADVPQNFQ